MKEKQKGRSLENLIFLLFLPILRAPYTAGVVGRGRGARGGGRRKEGEREILHVYLFALLCEALRASQPPVLGGTAHCPNHREAEAGIGFCQLRAIWGFQVPSDAPSPYSFFFGKGK